MRRGLFAILFALVLCFCVIFVSCDSGDNGGSNNAQESSKIGDTTTTNGGTDDTGNGSTAPSGDTNVPGNITSPSSGITADTGSGTVGTGGNSSDNSGNGEEDKPSHIHTFGDWRMLRLPTCTTAGEIQKDCTCGYSEIEPVAATGHTEITVEGKLPSCTESGLTDGLKCTVCNAIIIERTEIAPLGHSFSDWEETVAPACEEAGEEKRVCFCGEIETRVKEALGHSFGEWEETVAPTCEEAGEKKRYCVCGLEEEAVVEPLGHTEKTIAGLKPTCTESGFSDLVICSVCQKVFVDISTLEPLGHEYGDWAETLSPSCLESGIKERKCHCGAVDTDTVAPLGHSFGADNRCSVCGTELSNLIIISIDISSSMKELMASGESRFVALIDSLKKALENVPETTMIGIIAFDANPHVVLEPQFLPLDGRATMIKKIERQLMHTYYYHYLDANGKETEIPVGYDDGDKYTSAGLVRPDTTLTNGGYDKDNGYLIRTYGTAYFGPISWASEEFAKIEALNKSFIFISDGEPSDKNSGYIDIIADMAENNIFTSTIFLERATSSSSRAEAELICSKGRGIFFAVNSSFDLMRALYGLLEAEIEKIEENGFVFYNHGNDWYLIDYVGNDSDVVLPEAFRGEPYKIASNVFNNVESMHSITFPANITEIPSYTVTNCTHLYTVKFLADSTKINSYAFDGCVRIYEVYGATSGSSIKNSQGSIFRHSSLDEASYIHIYESGLVFAKKNNFIDVLDYIGSEKHLRVELPNELTEAPFQSAYVNFYSFYRTNIESVTFDEKITRICDFSFSECPSLTEVIFEGECTFLSSRNLFYNSPSIEFLVANSFSSFSDGLDAFPNVIFICTGDCTASYVEIVPVIKNCTDYGITEDGIKWAISSDYDAIIICGYSGEGTVVNVPSTINGLPVVAIANYAFARRTDITEISLPDTLVAVGQGAFNSESIIKKIDGVYLVDGWVVGCDIDLKEAYIPSGTVGIAGYAFSAMNNLRLIQVPSGLSYLSPNAVINCPNVTVALSYDEEYYASCVGWNPTNAHVLYNVCEEHTWVEGTCTSPKYCSVCSIIIGEPVHAVSAEANCTGDVYCSACSTLVYKKLSHTTTNGVSCSRCGVDLVSYKIGLEDIESLTASHTGGGAPYLEHLFDGEKETAGVYGENNKEYYAQAIGDYFTIELKNTETVSGVSFWGMGNWTQIEVSLYDEYGVLIYTTVHNYSSANITGGTSDEYSIYLNGYVNVKTVVGKVMQVKWSNTKTNKTSEVEIFTFREAE